MDGATGSIRKARRQRDGARGGGAFSFGRLGAALDRLTEVAAALGTVGIVLLLVFINLDVAARALFSQPLVGVPEVASIAIVGIVFLQAAQALVAGKLTRSELLLASLGARSRRCALFVDGVYHFLGAIPFAIVAWLGWDYALQSYRDGTFVGNLGVFTFPTWPVNLLFLAGAVLLVLQFVRIGTERCANALGQGAGAAR